MQGKCVSLLAYVFALCPLITASGQEISWMKLMTPQVGWAANLSHLYWTTDQGGHWKDVAPAMSAGEGIGGVFFLDTSTGWVLLSGADKEDVQQFRVAFTSDGGANWSSSPIKIPWKRYAEDFAGGGSVFFLDQLRGWVNLDVYGMLHAGRLLATQDGGKAWQATPDDSGRGGSFCFFNERDGILAGGPDETELWATHDASKNWQQVELKAPPEAAPTQSATYGPPICRDDKHGFLPVSYNRTDDLPGAFALFSTADGGVTWKPDRVLPHVDQPAPGIGVPSAVVDSTLLAVGHFQGTRTIGLVAAREGGSSSTNTSAELASHLFAVSEVTFADASHGWVSTSEGLFSTVDGGASWTNITPPR